MPAAIAAVAQENAVLAVAFVTERAPGPLLLLLLAAELRLRLGVLHRDVARRIDRVAHHGEPRAADGAAVVCLGPRRDAREAEGGVRAAVEGCLTLRPREADNAGLLILGAAAEAAEWSGAGIDGVRRLHADLGLHPCLGGRLHSEVPRKVDWTRRLWGNARNAEESLASAVLVCDECSERWCGLRETMSAVPAIEIDVYTDVA